LSWRFWPCAMMLSGTHTPWSHADRRFATPGVVAFFGTQREPAQLHVGYLVGSFTFVPHAAPPPPPPVPPLSPGVLSLDEQPLIPLHEPTIKKPRTVRTRPRA